MESLLKQVRARLHAFVWGPDLASLSRWHRLLLTTLRIGHVVSRDLIRGELTLRAMSLVYTTLLSLVPLLAAVFSVLKGFGVHQQVRPSLERFLEPLGPMGQQLAGDVVGFVENIDVGVLGVVGLLVLIYTAISLAHKVESAINFVWHIESGRSIGRRFGNYISFLVVGPLFVLGAMGITASVMSTTLVQQLRELGWLGALLVRSSRLAPYLLLWFAFGFIYHWMPNTRVRFAVAAIGGLVAGVLWQSTSWVFATFIVTSSRYAAVYSSFAILILALIWVYLNWLILLLGAQVAFLLQSPLYLTMSPTRLELSGRFKERLALTVMYLVADHYFHHRPAWTTDGLAERLQLPSGPVYSVVQLLCRIGMLQQTADEPPGFLPARALETIELDALLDAVRRAEETGFFRYEGMQTVAPIEALVSRVEGAVTTALDGANLRDLVCDERPAALATVPTNGAGGADS